jgi:hypothetical protein
MMRRLWRLGVLVGGVLAGWMALLATPNAVARQAATPAVRQAGTVKAISGNSITLAPDSGPEITIVVADSAKLVRVAPGQKDLKDAKPIQLTDIQPGDRILVRGIAGAVANSISASAVIDMSQTDLAAKQARDREEWQRHGVGGLVSSVDAAGGSVAISTAALTDKKTLTVRISAATVLRRYSPESTKFDDAKPAPIDAIKAGDQLRARGSRSEDGSELKADEIVSGTFRNLSGLVSSVDAAAGTLTLQDLATKKPVTVNVSSESQLRKLPAPMAQRIAMRLKGIAPDAAQAGGGTGSAGNASRNAAQGKAAAPNARPSEAPPGAGAGGALGGAGRQGGDLQQIISRMPSATLADLQKGDAVMLVATEGSASSPSTVITLLGGVEAILQASPTSNASTILSPWSLSGPADGGATP